MSKKLLATLLMVALAASAATLLVERLFFDPPAAKAETVAGLEAYQFFAQHRKDDSVDESFFFYNPKTGDIWIYQEDKPKEHYRVVALGEKL